MQSGIPREFSVYAQTPPNIESLAPPKHFFVWFFNAEGISTLKRVSK